MSRTYKPQRTWKPQQGATPVTRYKLWTRLVTNILDKALLPTSGYELLTNIGKEITTQKIVDPNHTDQPLPLPDQSVFDWMMKKGIITQYKFKNRTHPYYGRSLSVTYEFMNDDGAGDLPIETANQPRFVITSSGPVNMLGQTATPIPLQHEMVDKGTMATLISDMEVLQMKMESLEKRVNQMEEEKLEQEDILRRKPKTQRQLKTKPKSVKMKGA
jgi:hypothetical protein